MMALGSLGSSQHMAAELLCHVTATQFTTVPYRGGALALQDLIGGTVQTLCDGYPSSIQHIRRGTIKALGVTSPERIPSAPDIPAVAETLPGYSAYGWFGLVGPAGMDADVVAVLNQAGNQALQDPELRTRYAEVGATLHGGPRKCSSSTSRTKSNAGGRSSSRPTPSPNNKGFPLELDETTCLPR